MKTREVYDLLVDEEEFNKFLNILPECEKGEMYYMALFARKKYNDVIPSDKAQLKRNTTTKDQLKSKIKQLEVPYGCYTYGKDNSPVPENSLAVYLSITPRSFKKANGTLAKEIINNLVKDNYPNPKSLAMSVLQTSKSNGYFIDFDYDCKDDGFIEYLYYSLEGIINADAVNIIETRGGYHVLVKPHEVAKEYKRNWYINMTKIDKFDQVGDNLVPIPGTRQGDFIVKLLK